MAQILDIKYEDLKEEWHENGTGTKRRRCGSKGGTA
jgi:hypothetical protein